MTIVHEVTVNGTLGERELDVMAALWRDGAGTVAEVRARLPATLAYNTVLTILRNLESKGFVGHTAEGRTFRYHSVITEQAVRGSALTRLVDKLFRGSALRVVAHFVEQETLAPEELRDLLSLLDAHPEDGAAGTSAAKATSERAVSRPAQKPRRRS